MTDHDTPDASDPNGSERSAGILVGVGVIVLMVIVAVLAVASFNADDDQVVADDAPVASAPSTTATEPSDPAGRPGTDSALVGLTEAEVRELYPLVRVVEIDGEPLATTMDLQPGRINLALEGDVVVAATTEGCDESGPQDAEWIQQACDPDPDADGPDATGKLIEGEGAELVLEVGTQGEQYYQGMAVEADPDMTRVLDSQGTPLAAGDLVVGDVVWIWTTGECAESMPVQCDLAAVVVDRPAG